MNVLGYYVFDPARGWLQDDADTWAFDFHGGREFHGAKEAHEAAERLTGPLQSFYVLACLGSQ
jgi:hypothetical protein